MRRDDTSVTLEGPPCPQELQHITVIQREGGRIEVAHTYMEVRIDRHEIRGRTINEVVEALKQKGWK